MRVCMVAYAFYDSDTRIMRYAEALVQRGDQVDVIALRRPDQLESEEVNGVRVLRIQQRQPNDSARTSYLSQVLTFLFRSMFLLTRRHLRSSYRLIHVHSVPDFLIFSCWLPKLTGAKLILDIHDLLPEFYASKYGTLQNSTAFKLLVAAEWISAAFADHVIAANDLWADRLTHRLVGATPCTAMVNVPDRSIFCPQGRTRQDGKFIILYPGTLNWHQGVDIAIRAFSSIKDAVPEAEFHIYGEGPYQESLVQLIQELGLQKRVVMRGFVSTREIARVMENADLAVVPKRKDGFGNEAFSTKIMEFMAMGVPVIVSDTQVDRYYFNHAIVKFFRSGDEHDLAAAMLELIKNPTLRAKLVQGATEFVQRNDWSRMKVDYLNLVDSLVDGCQNRELVNV